MERILVVTGPSGVGKSTFIDFLLTKPLFKFSVSYTTRNPRPNEKHGIHYFFTSREDFEQKIAEGFFLESKEYNGNLYGTPVSSFGEESILILDIEEDGLKFIKQLFPRCFFCLVTAQRIILEKRLFSRVAANPDGDNSDYQDRLNKYDRFVELKKEFDFNFIVENSKGIEELKATAETLAEEVLEYYDIK